MLDRRTEIYVHGRGTVTIVRYRDEIWEPFQRCRWTWFHLNGWQRPTTRAHLVDNFLETEDIRCRDWPGIFSNNNSIEHVLWRFGEGDWNSQPPCKNYPGPENSVPERVDMCKRAPYSLLTHFFDTLTTVSHFQFPISVTLIMRAYYNCFSMVILLALYQTMFIANFIIICPVVLVINGQIWKFP